MSHFHFKRERALLLTSALASATLSGALCAKPVVVTNGDDKFLLSENQSTFIPLGATHCIENPGKVPLEIIEVQSGTYLGEDDIVRFEDLYGRLGGPGK